MECSSPPRLETDTLGDGLGDTYHTLLPMLLASAQFEYGISPLWAILAIAIPAILVVALIWIGSRSRV